MKAALRMPTLRTFLSSGVLAACLLSSAAAAPRIPPADPELLEAVSAHAASDSGRVRVVRDQVFAEVDQQPLHCDLYFPPDRGEPGSAAFEPRPAVLVVHGGGWSSGDKRFQGVYARGLAEAGMVAVAINYRLAPESPFPAQLDDLRAALLWIAEHAEVLGIDTSRLGAFGYSAGGHLACLAGTLRDAPWSQLAATTAWPEHERLWDQLPRLRAVAAGGAPCDFQSLPPENASLAYFLGGSRGEAPEVYRAASPLAHAAPGNPPTLLVHGTRDLLVPMTSSRALFETQRRLGVCSEYLALEDQGHVLTFLHPAAQRAVVGFMRSRLVDSAATTP
jgi:acetyl esterase/lipase